jgi:hypothetical protein
MSAREKEEEKSLLTAAFLVRSIGAVTIEVADPREGNALARPTFASELILGAVLGSCLTHTRGTPKGQTLIHLAHSLGGPVIRDNSEIYS